MLVNADCTLYMVDGSTYRRIPVSGVHWENTRGANLSKTGSTAVDAIAVHIPFSSLPADALSERVSGRDYIIRGIVEDDPETVPVRDIVSRHEAFTVSSIKKCDYGSPAMQHWEVGAK